MKKRFSDIYPPPDRKVVVGNYLRPSRHPKQYKSLNQGVWTLATCAECGIDFDIFVVKIPEGDGWCRCGICQRTKRERDGYVSARNLGLGY